MGTLNAALAPADYGRTLDDYVREQSEQVLYRASLLSQSCVEGGLGPEDIIALHFESLDGILERLHPRGRARAHADAQHFLLEVMIAYGVRYKEYLDLKLLEAQRSADARAQRDHERALDAERLSHEREELLGVIAHELRTPITVVQAHLDLATRAVESGRLEPLARYLGSARAALDRLSRLSADLVEGSRGEQPTFELTPLDLVAVVEQACAWARPAAASQQIRLDHQLAADRPLIRANADALLSVFGNLFSNAVRYTPPGGQVRVHYQAVPAGVRVVVDDTGIGMPPEVQARVFEKFYRAPDARRMEARGLGLGLALVRQLVAAHRGTVEVKSSPGQGSTFSVTLPADPATTSEEENGERDKSTAGAAAGRVRDDRGATANHQ